MTRYIRTTLLFTFLLAYASCKKDVLRWQHVQQLSSNTTSKLNHIRFITDSISVIGGGVHFEKAEVLRSVDGGYTWNNYSYPEAGKGMYGLGVGVDGTIYMCGTDGCLLHSYDSGASFGFRRILDWEYYVGVSFPEPNTGFLVTTHLDEDGSITKIDTACNILDKKYFSFGLSDIYMVSPQIGYVIGYGAVLKTTDGGNNWSFLDPQGDKFMCMDIHGGELWLCGYAGSIFHSTDAGAHWSRIRNGNDLTIKRYRMLSIVFRDSQNGWASCDDGTVIYTDDGGLHWSEYDRFTNQALRSIVICPNKDLLVAGDNGALYRLTP